MNAIEMSKPSTSGEKDYGLTVTLTVAAMSELGRELRQAKEALLLWAAQRGDSARLVTFTIIAPEALHHECQDVLNRVYREEAELAPLLQAMGVKASLLDEKGKPRRSWSPEP